VRGVLDVANDLVAEIAGRERHSDTEIAQAVRDALRWHAFVDDKKIRSTVTDGWITLEGEVAQWFQRSDAERAAERLSAAEPQPKARCGPPELRRAAFSGQHSAVSFRSVAG